MLLLCRRSWSIGKDIYVGSRNRLFVEIDVLSGWRIDVVPLLLAVVDLGLRLI